MIRRVLREWDFWLIWACVAALALLVGGAISATVEAVQSAVSYP